MLWPPRPVLGLLTSQALSCIHSLRWSQALSSRVHSHVRSRECDSGPHGGGKLRVPSGCVQAITGLAGVSCGNRAYISMCFQVASQLRLFTILIPKSYSLENIQILWVILAKSLLIKDQSV